jgi:hypothetical protein
MENSNNEERLVWVFTAADEALPTVVFDQRELAEDWVRKNDPLGTLAAFPINEPVPPDERPLAPLIGSNPTLEEHGNHLLGAISKCIRSGYQLPALILMYSAIDIMAWLDRDEKASDVTRSDFIRWAETYLLPDSGLDCTATDLYAARCAVLHSYTARSQLSRKGRAKEIFYAWGTAKEETLRATLARSSLRNQVCVVHIDKLLKALRRGIAEFTKVKGNTPLVHKRIRSFYGHVSDVDNEQ